MRKKFYQFDYYSSVAIELLLLFLIDYTKSGQTGESPEEEQQEYIVNVAGREIGEVNLSADDLRPAMGVDNTNITT